MNSRPTLPVSDKALIEQVSVPDRLPSEIDDTVWVEVIQQMDSIYSDLVRHQIELEEKNNTLEETHRQLQQAHEDLQQTQKQLIQSEKMASLGRLVAGVAHELNNPISFILGNAHTLKRYKERLQRFFSGLRSVADPRIQSLKEDNKIDPMLKDLDPLVEGTMEGADRVSGIVDALLRFTKPQQQSAAPFDASNLIHTATQWVLRAVSFKPRVIIDVPESIVLHSYEGPVHQILVNLLQNAVDAVEKNTDPTVWISLSHSETNLQITVRDNGAGIDLDRRDKIFEPFFTTKLAGKGTGLGLYISYLLATEQCGGSLDAGNHPEGGAEFHLSLPIASAGGKV